MRRFRGGPEADRRSLHHTLEPSMQHGGPEEARSARKRHGGGGTVEEGGEGIEEAGVA